jgi:WD40 repeat protein
LKDNKPIIKCLAFSPDGTLLASGGARGGVQLWDATTGTLKSRLGRCDFPVKDLFFIRGGAELLALAGRFRAWQIEPPRDSEPGWGRLGWRILAAAVTPDQQFLCLGGHCSLACHRLPRCGKRWQQRVWGVTALAFSSDGQTLFTGGFNGQIVLRRATTGGMQKELPCENPTIDAVAPSPDGQRLAWTAGCHLRLWQLDPPGEIAHHSLGRTHFLGVAFHPSGRFFASVNGDGKVDFWDAHTGQHQQAYDWKIGKLNDVIFDTAGDRAACCSDTGEIVIWDVE